VEGFGDGDWNAFFETADDYGDDQLYLQGNGELANLPGVARPHGNNNWNDRIAQVKFGVAPPQQIDNCTVLSHGSRRYKMGSDDWDELDSSNPGWGASASKRR
jgi:hypothetical protein